MHLIKIQGKNLQTASKPQNVMLGTAATLYQSSHTLLDNMTPRVSK